MKESSKKAQKVLSSLKKLYPNPRHYLVFNNTFELLIATILSAQCTDAKVNEVTRGLFERYPGPGDLAGEGIEAIEEAVRPTGFYRNKAKAVKAASKEILERFGGRVPGTMEELLTIPGIARKSANAILQHGFSKVEGIVVDTHVSRLASRLGWTANRDPVKIEGDLTSLFGREDWIWIPFYLKNHGRSVCRARSPKCPGCAVSNLCPAAGSFGRDNRRRGGKRV